jgi:3-methyladenine DNA glycosylase/8-oxoguanine DNA glycosylase
MSITNLSEAAPITLLSSEVIRAAERHLSGVDPVMAQLVATYRPLREENFALPPFHRLASSIISQLVTTAAAKVLNAVFLKWLRLSARMAFSQYR